MASEPRTLQDAILLFSDADYCLTFLARRRWKTGVFCPTCGRTDVTFVAARSVWQCKTRHPKYQFSVRTGTIFEDSAIPLNKWLLALWMHSDNQEVGSREIMRYTGVTQKTAWLMLHRVRLVMQSSRRIKTP